jgi:hypothetical protein
MISIKDAAGWRQSDGLAVTAAGQYCSLLKDFDGSVSVRICCSILTGCAELSRFPLIVRLGCIFVAGPRLLPVTECVGPSLDPRERHRKEPKNNDGHTIQITESWRSGSLG